MSLDEADKQWIVEMERLDDRIDQLDDRLRKLEGRSPQ